MHKSNGSQNELQTNRTRMTSDGGWSAVCLYVTLEWSMSLSLLLVFTHAHTKNAESSMGQNRMSCSFPKPIALINLPSSLYYK